MIYQAVKKILHLITYGKTAESIGQGWLIKLIFESKKLRRFVPQNVISQ